MVTFNFFYIGLSRSHYLDHEFCKFFLDRGFFKNKTVFLYLIFADFLFYFILYI